MSRLSVMHRSTFALLLAVAACSSTAATARPVPTPTRFPAQVGVVNSRGTVHLDVVQSEALGVAKRVSVYLPPSYEQDRTRRYPVVIYLHGLFGSETDWLSKGGLDAVADSLANAGRGDAIIVTPDGDDGWWTNWPVEPSYAACAMCDYRLVCPAAER